MIVHINQTIVCMCSIFASSFSVLPAALWGKQETNYRGLIASLAFLGLSQLSNLVMAVYSLLSHPFALQPNLR